MLKAGEYSPNNPLIRGERTSGDVLLGLGEYERRRNTLRKLRQQQYREYLDQQAKKKQDAKEKAERERREQEEKEREKEERERERLRIEREKSPARKLKPFPLPHTAHCVTKVDTGVQVDGITQPLSVAVQTDNQDLYRVYGCGQLTEAERELSPRSVQPSPVQRHSPEHARRRSHGDFDQRSTLLKTNRDKLASELRHTYMPSIFDADAIHMRNLQAEKEAAAKRQSYQQELRNQILEQQRIKEERKSREKLLEQAEMRRLEDQLRMLRAAQDAEIVKQHHVQKTMKENSIEYNAKRIELNKEIEREKQNLNKIRNQNYTAKSDPLTHSYTEPKTYSTNIPKNSIFSPDYDVDAYLRKNLNFTVTNNKFDENFGQKVTPNDHLVSVHRHSSNGNTENRFKDETVPVLKHFHNNNSHLVNTKDLRQPNEALPVLRHIPNNGNEIREDKSLSDAMKTVEVKWKVPAIQKNSVKSVSNSEGKNISILTQLGSIRRQLQLEQLKLDEMLGQDKV